MLLEYSLTFSYNILGVDDLSNVVSEQLRSNKSVFSRNSKSQIKEEVSKMGSKAKSESRANRSINLMVIAISFYYVIGTVPYSIVTIIAQFTSVDSGLLACVTASAYFSHGGSIFIFYGFNTLYRQTLNGYITNRFLINK